MGSAVDTNRSVQGLWIGQRLSVMEQLSTRSFLANVHEYHLYVCGDVQDVPRGAVLKDANAILDRSRILTFQSGFGKNSNAGFADLSRHKLLATRGGRSMAGVKSTLSAPAYLPSIVITPPQPSGGPSGRAFM
jgi:hypothetical protein